ncbi:MAG: hypothetical protein ACYC0B_11645 [Gemmatimonadaceae bacterium]
MTPWSSRTWKRIGLAAGMGLVVAFIAVRYVVASIDEYYSPSFTSPSSSEAARTGVLVARPTLRDSTIRVGRIEAQVLDIWYEQETRIEYTLLIRRRVVRLDRVRLVAHVRMPQLDYAPGALYALSGVEESDTMRFTGRSGTRQRAEFSRSAAPWVVDTLRLIWKDG